MNLSSIFLMLGGQDGQGSGMTSIIFLILIFGVFWLFMIRPQMKKQKDQQKFREAIGKGDKIITIGGVHGKIVEVQDTTFIIEVEGQNRLKIEKSAVSMESSQAMNKDKEKK
ncbi:MAG: preprotein translocase subunit YajC [Bacteroidetes bacterium]|nr:preprotein translocase subunit YajC [Bacteroidota bacterium]